LEKATSGFYIQLSVVLATIYKEVDREDRISISTDVTGCNKGKCGIGSDGVLNTVVAVLGCDGQVVLPASKPVTEVRKL